MAGQSTPVRMEPIATLPIFFKLAGKRAVLAGGGAPAVWKAELLSAAGARVDVLAPDPVEELTALVANPPGGPISIHHRAWTAADLRGAAIALGAIDEDDEAAAFQAAARAAGVPVNVIDKPAFCDFQFGTVVSRSPLVIGISTDGAAPVFGQAIRARIEALLPQSLKAWAEAARDWRPSVQAQGLGFNARRRFWAAFADRALSTPDALPTEIDRAACTAAALSESGNPTGQRLTLVGAGSGDTDGITLAAIKALQEAELVLHREGLPPSLVGLARREATKIQIPAELDPAAAAHYVSGQLGSGRRTAWLDTGDPMTCLRWRDRASALASLPHLDKVRGLGPCEECRPDCPAFARDDRGR